MKRLYKNFTLPENGKENMAKVVSKTQLEYVILEANKADVTLGFTPESKADVLVDLTPMAEILHVDQGSKSATVQSGIVMKDLLSGLKKHGLTLGCMPQVPLDTTLD